MNEAYKHSLKIACLRRGWTFEEFEMGVIINGSHLETLAELDAYIENNA